MADITVRSDPLNRLLVEHVSATRVNAPGRTHHVIPVGNNELLDWTEETGAYNVWLRDTHAGPTADPFRVTPRTSGAWATIRTGHRLVWLASEPGDWFAGNVLDWVPDTGGAIYLLDRSVTSGDPMPSLLNIGTWAIPQQRTLIYLDHDRVLDWDSTTGNAIVWGYDRTVVDGDPMPDLITQTTWDTVLQDHQLVYLGGDLLLFWNQTTGSVQVWRYDRSARGEVDPFPTLAMEDSWAGEIDASHVVVYLGGDLALEWDPATGQERVWSLDRPMMPADQFAAMLSSDIALAIQWITVARQRLQSFAAGLASGAHDSDFDATAAALATHFHAQTHPAGTVAAVATILNTYNLIFTRLTTGAASITQVSKEDAIRDLQGVENYTRGYTFPGNATRLTPAYRPVDTVGSFGLDGAGPRLRAAILIHEATHFVGNNPDSALEWQPAYDTLDPQLAVTNPASYAGFAHQVFENWDLRFGNEPWL
jgi:hypothetical protein